MRLSACQHFPSHGRVYLDVPGSSARCAPTAAFVGSTKASRASGSRRAISGGMSRAGDMVEAVEVIEVVEVVEVVVEADP